jgi:hypothetical protein
MLNVELFHTSTFNIRHSTFICSQHCEYGNSNDQLNITHKKMAALAGRHYKCTIS